MKTFERNYAPKSFERIMIDAKYFEKHFETFRKVLKYIEKPFLE